MIPVDTHSIHHDVCGEDILVSEDMRFREYRDKWEKNPRLHIVEAFPLHLDIEVTSVCNLRCPFCATTFTSKKIKNGYMKWEMVRKILDEAGRFNLYACKFNFRGEPLLHEDLEKFIRYAKGKGVMDVFLNTNGLLLDGDKSNMLIDAGLDRLTLSFEGWDKKTYERYRKGSDFYRVISNITRLRNFREQRGSKTPKIRVQGVLVPEMKNNLEAYASFWKEKVDQVSYNDMLDNIPGHVPHIVSDWVCPLLYQRMMILWDGAITTCYNDHHGRNLMGHVDKTSLHECWQHQFNHLRDVHQQGLAHELRVCSVCPLRMHEINKRKSAVRE